MKNISFRLSDIQVDFRVNDDNSYCQIRVSRFPGERYFVKARKFADMSAIDHLFYMVFEERHSFFGDDKKRVIERKIRERLSLKVF